MKILNSQGKIGMGKKIIIYLKEYSIFKDLKKKRVKIMQNLATVFTFMFILKIFSFKYNYNSY